MNGVSINRVSINGVSMNRVSMNRLSIIRGGAEKSGNPASDNGFQQPLGMTGFLVSKSKHTKMYHDVPMENDQKMSQITK
jgi:hypothetical protein